MSGSLQWAVLAPVTVLATLGVVQAGVLVHARAAISEAAAAAVEAFAIAGDERQAREVAARVAGSASLTELEVSLSQDATTVTISLAARATTFLDLGQGRVSARASQPREQPR